MKNYNQIEETLKHNWEVALTNAINVMLTPENFTTSQRLDAREALRKMKTKLIAIDSFEAPQLHPVFDNILKQFTNSDLINNQSAGAIEFEDHESDVDNGNYQHRMLQKHGHEANEFGC